MKSLFQSIKIRQRETLVREHLTGELMSAVKDVQLCKNLLENDTYSTSEDAGKSLVLVLEAIFIHGVKETFVDRVSAALGDIDHKPAPEFWSPMMVFTHSHIIKQINNMTQIATDIGRSRSWIRLVLNDGLLLSYLQMMSQDNRTLRSFYKRTAYLLDTESVGVARNVLQGLAQFSFSFPTNSSILNYWSDEPLLLAGLWTPPMKECPVQTGFDIVKNIPDAPIAEDNRSLNSYDSLSGSQKLLMDEEEALKIILNTPIEGSPLRTRVDSETLTDPLEPGMLDIQAQTEQLVAESSLEPQDARVVEEDNVFQPSTKQKPVEKQEPAATMLSYDEILHNYSKNESLEVLKKPELEHFISNYKVEGVANSDSGAAPSSNVLTPDPENDIILQGFEVVHKTAITSCKSEFKHLVDVVRSAKIISEPGLDSQRFSCKSCQMVIGISGKQAKCCALTGAYYCSYCFKGVDWVIPARIIRNWDFTRHKVSRISADFLNEIQMHPLFDVRKINPKIYFVVEEMELVQKLRMEMNLLRPYLTTCHDPIKSRIQTMLWPREYLFEHVHLYSISDLVEVATGVVQDLLKKAIHMSREHVMNCQLCSQKGYFCEICDSRETIYPFDISTTTKCSTCRSLFHNVCMKNLLKSEESCPKCKRINERKAKLSEISIS